MALDELKSLMQNREKDKILELVRRNPLILEETDQNGLSGFMYMIYMRDEVLTSKIVEEKTSFTFFEAAAVGLLEKVAAKLKDNPELLNQHANDGFTAIALAAFFGRSEVVDYLLKQGADPNINATNPTKVNALHAAVAFNDLALCSLLVKNGADVNKTQMQNVTPLHSAVHRGNMDIVKLLVSNGAEINTKQDNGDTALSIAKNENQIEILEYLSSLS